MGGDNSVFRNFLLIIFMTDKGGERGRVRKRDNDKRLFDLILLVCVSFENNIFTFVVVVVISLYVLKYKKIQLFLFNLLSFFLIYLSLFSFCSIIVINTSALSHHQMRKSRSLSIWNGFKNLSIIFTRKKNTASLTLTMMMMMKRRKQKRYKF